MTDIKVARAVKLIQIKATRVICLSDCPSTEYMSNVLTDESMTIPAS